MSREVAMVLVWREMAIWYKKRRVKIGSSRKEEEKKMRESWLEEKKMRRKRKEKEKEREK